MDMSTVTSNLRSLQSAASTTALNKAMNKDAQAMAVMLEDMKQATATPPPNFGRMDILV